MYRKEVLKFVEKPQQIALFKRLTSVKDRFQPSGRSKHSEREKVSHILGLSNG